MLALEDSSLSYHTSLQLSQGAGTMSHHKFMHKVLEIDLDLFRLFPLFEGVVV